LKRGSRIVIAPIGELPTLKSDPDLRWHPPMGRGIITLTQAPKRDLAIQLDKTQLQY